MINTTLGAITPVVIPPQILWSVFSVLIIIIAVMSLVLFYHWRKYGYGIIRIGVIIIIYIIGTITLTGFLFSSISGYIASI